MHIARLVSLLAVALFSLACVNTGEKRTFSLEVANNAKTPVTMGLAKLDGVVEVEWESPEDRAIMDPKLTGLGWGTVLPPGRTASLRVSGRFLPNTRGFLRIYNGDLPLSEILAISKGSRNRIDILLREGNSAFVITNAGPFLSAQLASYTPTGEAAKLTPPTTVSPTQR